MKKSKFEFTNKAITPEFVISGLVPGRDYSFLCYDNIESGRAPYVLKGKRNYQGTMTGSFLIYPRTMKVMKIKRGPKGSGQLKVTLNGGIIKAGADKFIIQVVGNGKRKKIKSKSTTTTISNLKAGKKYKIRVKAISKVNGKVFEGKWSKKNPRKSDKFC